MAPEVVAEGVVLLRLQESIDRDMQDAQRKLERRMEDLDGQEASLRVNVKHKDALASLKLIEERYEEHQDALDKAQKAGDKKAARNARDRLRRAEKDLGDWADANEALSLRLGRIEKGRLRAQQDFERRQSQITRNGEKARADIARKYAEQRAKDEKDALDELKAAVQKFQRNREKAEADHQNRLERERNAARRRESRQMRARVAAERKAMSDGMALARAHAAATHEDSRRTYDAATASQRRALEEAKLNQELVKQARLLNRLHRQRPPLRREQRQQYDIDVTQATARIEALKAELTALGMRQVDIKINVNRTFVTRIEDATRKLLDFAGGFRNISVRVGPFTTSMGVLLKALIVLGPVITSLIGSISALVGAMGAGLVGAATLAGAAMSGLVISTLGVIMAVKPAVAEIKNAMKASEAYDKAVREYGRGSEQASKKLKIFNNVMKHQSAEAKRNYLAGGRMVEKWKELTAPARQTAFEVMGRGIRFASDNMGWFARHTNAATKSIGDGLSSWMDRLGSVGGRSVLQNIFGNWNEALPDLMRGLGNVGAYLGKVFSQASNHLPGIVSTFERWSDNMNKGFRGSSIDRLVGEAKTLGNFLLAAGRAIRAFFSTGREGGGRFLEDMTRGLEKWTDHMEGPGADAYRKFFDDARKNTEALFGVLGPVFGQFISWATTMTPFITGFLVGLGTVTTILMSGLNILMKIGDTLLGVGTTASAVGATMAAIWAFGKITAFGAAILKIGAALRGLIVVLGIARAAIATTFAMGSISAGLATMSAGLAATRVGAAGAATGMAALNPLLVLGAVTVGALGVAFNKLQGASNRWRDEAREAGRAAMDMSNEIAAANGELITDAQSFAGTYGALTDAADRVRESEKRVAEAQALVNKLRRAGKTDTDAYKDATRALTAEEKELQAVQGDYYSQRDTAQKQQLELLDKAKQRIKDQQKAYADAGNAAQKLYRYETDDAPGLRVLGGKTWKDDLRQFHDEARKTGKSLKRVIQDYIAGPHKDSSLFKGFEGDERKLKAAKDYIDLMNKQEAIRKNISEAENDALLTQLNLGRAKRRQATLGILDARATADAFAAVAKQAGKVQGRRIVHRISTQYDDPQKALAVAQRASAALKRGVSPRIVFDIIARDKPARDTIDALDRRKPKDKKVPIKGDKKHADGEIDKIDRRNPKPKRVPIGANPGVFNTVWSVIGGLEKSLSVIIKGDPSPLQRLWDSLSGWAKTLFVGIQGRPKGRTRMMGGPVEPFQSGGQSSANRVIADAARRSSVMSPRPTRGGRYQKPTLLVGEEDRTEYVIATNPAYRDSNTRYLAQAASDFGYTLTGPKGVIAARKGKAPKPQTRRPKNSKGWRELEGVYTEGPKGQNKKPRKWWAPRGWRVDPSTNQVVGPNWVIDKAGRFTSPERFKVTSPRRALTDSAARVGAVDPTIGSTVITEYENLTKSIRRQQTRLKDARAEKITGKTKAQRESRSAAKKKKVARYERDLRRDQKKRDKLAKKYNLSKINQASNNAIGMLEDQAAAALDEMSTAEARGNVDGFFDARNKRLNALGGADGKGGLIGRLSKAVSKARAPYKADLERRLQDAINDWTDTQNEGYQGGADASSMLTREEAAQLEKIRADISLGEAGVDPRYVDSYRDLLPGDETPTAAEALPAFWRRELEEAKSSGANPATIAAIAQELAGATGGAGAEAAEGPTQGQLLNTERMSLLRDFASNTYSFGIGSAGSSGPAGGGMGFNSSALSDPYAGSDVTNAMTGGSMAARSMQPSGPSAMSFSGQGGATGTVQKNVTVNNTFATVPPDPHTWSRGIEYEIGTLD